MITIKQYDDFRKKIVSAALAAKVPGYRLTLGLTAELFDDLCAVVDRTGDRCTAEYFFYGVPVRILDGCGRRWMLYIAKGDIT